MVTLYKNDNVKNTAEGTKTYCEFRGLSTDTKPTEFNGYTIGNGSVFIEIDTQKVFIYNETSQEWIGE
jgi:hypothetical protein